MRDLASADAEDRGALPAAIDLAAARSWLLAAPRDLATLPAERLAEMLSRLRHCYDQYPELEVAAPRGALIGELRTLAGAASDRLAVPLLIAAAILEAPAAPDRVADLLLRMARSGYENAIGEVIAALTAHRTLEWAEIAAALDELCRRRLFAPALDAVSRVLDHLADDRDRMSELGALLHLLLPGSNAFAADPRNLAETMIAARARLRVRAVDPRRGRILAFPGSDAGSAAEPAHRTLRASRREPAAPLPGAAEGEIEWLPAMRVGRAGQRGDRGIDAKPGETGHLVYGPYVALGNGDYRVRIGWEAGEPWRAAPRSQPVAVIEAVSRYGKLYLAQRELTVADCASPKHELRFRLGARSAPAFEVRVWTAGIVPLTIVSITIERLYLREADMSRKHRAAE